MNEVKQNAQESTQETKHTTTSNLKTPKTHYVFLAALPLLFIALPWALAVTTPQHTTTAILVTTPIALIALAIADATLHRPNLTFLTIAGISAWIATAMYYPTGAGWYIPAILLICVIAFAPWHKKWQSAREQDTTEQDAH